MAIIQYPKYEYGQLINWDHGVTISASQAYLTSEAVYIPKVFRAIALLFLTQQLKMSNKQLQYLGCNLPWVQPSCTYGSNSVQSQSPLQLVICTSGSNSVETAPCNEKIWKRVGRQQLAVTPWGPWRRASSGRRCGRGRATSSCPARAWSATRSTGVLIFSIR